MKTEAKITKTNGLIQLNPGVYPAVWSNGNRTIIIPEEPIQSEHWRAGDVDSFCDALTGKRGYGQSNGFVFIDKIVAKPVTSHYSGEFGGDLSMTCPLEEHEAFRAISNGAARTQRDLFDVLASVVGQRLRDLPAVLMALKTLKSVNGVAIETDVDQFQETETAAKNRKVQSVNGELPSVIHYSGQAYQNAPTLIEMDFKLEHKDGKFVLIPLERRDAVLAARRSLVADLRDRCGPEHHFYLGG